MSTVDYANLYASAIEEAGSGFSEVLPDSEYVVEIAQVRKGQAKSGGKPQVGIRVKVLEGPHAGKSTWVNQTFSAENPSAVAIFIRIMKSLGVPQSAIDAGVAPNVLGDYIVIGSQGVMELGHHDWNDNTYQDLKKFTLTTVPQVSVPGPGIVVQPAADAAVPVTVATAPPF